MSPISKVDEERIRRADPTASALKESANEGDIAREGVVIQCALFVSNLHQPADRYGFAPKDSAVVVISNGDNIGNSSATH
jgi:hypothetical protein